MTEYQLKKRIRVCIWIVIAGLLISGVTAFPLETELAFIKDHSTGLPVFMRRWFITIYLAVHHTNDMYPYLSYGTDWLAFAHLLLGALFWGPLIDPVKNIWVIRFGMMACILIFPLAFIAGPIRHIPFFWRVVDCSFGLIGIIPLFICHSAIKTLENELSVQQT